MKKLVDFINEQLIMELSSQKVRDAEKTAHERGQHERADRFKDYAEKLEKIEKEKREKYQKNENGGLNEQLWNRLLENDKSLTKELITILKKVEKLIKDNNKDKISKLKTLDFKYIGTRIQSEEGPAFMYFKNDNGFEVMLNISWFDLSELKEIPYLFEDCGINICFGDFEIYDIYGTKSDRCVCNDRTNNRKLANQIVKYWNALSSTKISVQLLIA